MTITFVLGTLEYISANFINPYTGEILEIEGEYYINDTPVDGGTGTADILLGSTHNQFFSLEDPSGNILLEDLEIFLMAAGHDIINLSSDTVVLGNTEIQMAEGDDIVWANVGDDLIGGSLGDDILNGGPGNDTLNGDEDNDILIGWTGDDTLNGGTGQDTLEGGADNDVYMFAPGDGTDIITETLGMDTLVFTDGIILTDLTFTQVGDDLQIDLDVGGLTSAITVTGFYSGDPDLTVETAEFDDGSSFDLLSLLTPPNLGAPDAMNDAISNNVSYGIISGNVMDNDVASPDGGTTVSEVTFGGTTFTVPTDGTDLNVITPNGVLVINNTGAYIYAPYSISPTVASVADEFEYTLTDVDGDTDTASFDITTVNDSYDLGEPDAVGDVVSFDVSDGLVTGNVMGNDVASPDAPTLLTEVSFGASSVTVPSDGSNVTIIGDNGVLTINNTGIYSYTPNVIGSTVASVMDQFSYTLGDIDGDTDTATLDITTVNDSYDLGEPDAVNDAVTFNSDDGSVTGDVTGNDVASPDGPTLLTQVTFGVTTVSVPTDGSDVSITGLNGVLTINNSGAYSYSPFPISAVVESVVDTFEYTLGDVDGDLDTATLEITTINDDLNLGDPDAVNDAVSFDYDDGSVTGNVTDNDTDSPDGGTAVTAVAFGGTSVTVPNDGSDVTVTGDHGILTINSTGAYSYSPFAIDSDTASVLDQFEYTLSDVNGDTDTASLDITTLNDINDVINGTSGNDVLSGGAGDDIIDGLGGSDKLLGGEGDDTLLYSNDAIWTSGFVAWNVGAPDAVINGDKVTVAPRYRNHDNFDSGEGTDTLIMGDDDEALFLDDRYSDNPDGYNTARIIDIEIIRAGDGDDIVDLTSKQFMYGDVSIYGDGGNDVLWGNAGDDYIEGGTGNDHLDGASGNDTLFGGAGNDRMFGQSGDDTFIVGEGNDKIYTGSGVDTIVYNMVDSKSDHVFDFEASEGDRLDLSDILEGYDALTDAISDFVTVTQQGANTIISVDVDGGADNFVQIAKLHGVCGLGDAQSLEDSGTLITM